MRKIRLMRVFNQGRGRPVWVPRLLFELGFKTDNLSKEPEVVRNMVALAERYNRAEARK